MSTNKTISQESGDFDNLFRIECAICGNSTPLLAWTETEISGPLPVGTYQCPYCCADFRRQWNPKHEPWKTGIECVPTEAML